MKLNPFNPKKTPPNRLLLVYFHDWGFRLAAYKKISPRSDRPVWVTQGTGCHGEANGDWHYTEHTFWCELPEAPAIDEGYTPSPLWGGVPETTEAEVK